LYRALANEKLLWFAGVGILPSAIFAAARMKLHPHK